MLLTHDCSNSDDVEHEVDKRKPPQGGGSHTHTVVGVQATGRPATRKEVWVECVGFVVWDLPEALQCCSSQHHGQDPNFGSTAPRDFLIQWRAMEQ